MTLITTGKKFKAFMACEDPDIFPTAAHFGEHEADFEEYVYIMGESLSIDGAVYGEMINGAYEPADLSSGLNDMPLNDIPDAAVIEILAGQVGQRDEDLGSLVDYFKKWDAKLGSSFA
jgi:hypothetical protein